MSLRACLLLFCPCVLFAAPVGATDAVEPAASPAVVSRIDVNASLSLAHLQQRMRVAVAEALRRSPPVAQRHRESGVTVTVTPRMDGGALQIAADPNGVLRMTLPVAMRVDVSIDRGTDLVVGRVGCAAVTFRIRAWLVPRFSPAGELRYALRSVDNDRRDYECRIESKGIVDAGKAAGETFASGFGLIRKPDYSKAIRVDVSARIQAGLRASGREVIEEHRADIGALLPDAAALQRMLRPAVFGDALALGIDAPRLRFTGASANGEDYRLAAVLEGRPRLVFGSDWQVREPNDTPADNADGFRLPVRLLLPTDTKALTGDDTPPPASHCVGGFRLRRVTGRHDLAALQRCGADGQGDVIWLSGDDTAPPGRVHVFKRSMANVLQEIVDWLGDDALWDGVDGIDALRREVAAMRDRLLLFQQDTRLPVENRGAIHFSQLSVDLRRVWVTANAILADVELTGQARLDMRVAL